MQHMLRQHAPEVFVFGIDDVEPHELRFDTPFFLQLAFFALENITIATISRMVRWATAAHVPNFTNYITQSDMYSHFCFSSHSLDI